MLHYTEDRGQQKTGFPGGCFPAVSRVWGKPGPEPWDPGWEAMGMLPPAPAPGPCGTCVAWCGDHGGVMPQLTGGDGECRGIGWVHS